MPASSLDDYELRDVIGVGTVGTIYLGVDRATGRRVAVKKLHAKVCNDPLIRARFKREMQVLERLRHKNIVEYFGGGGSPAERRELESDRSRAPAARGFSGLARGERARPDVARRK